MNKTITLLVLLLSSSITLAQQILISGEYNYGLNLAFDSQTNRISGYYENYTGWDESTNNPSFSCIFYIEGTLKDGKSVIKTYYPNDEKEDLIEGNLEILNNNTIAIKLNEEHGGCWNVEHFTNEPAKFELGTPTKWFQIRFVKAPKTYFYNNLDKKKKTKKYLVSGDFVCIEKIENDMAYVTYFGKKTTKGWITVRDLNKL